MDSDRVYTAVLNLQSTIDARLSAVEAKQAATVERLDALSKAVAGNGTPGLAQRVTALETKGARAAGFASAVGIAVGALLDSTSRWLWTVLHVRR